MTSGRKANLCRTINRLRDETLQLAQRNTDNKTRSQKKNALSAERREIQGIERRLPGSVC
jgi:hypothetical protein